MAGGVISGACGTGGASSLAPPDQLLSKRSGLGMARSISDTTLRKAALHLNLSQSVLPSFTSLQQFKVMYLFYSIALGTLPPPPPSYCRADTGRNTNMPAAAAACLFRINVTFQYFDVLERWAGGPLGYPHCVLRPIARRILHL